MHGQNDATYLYQRGGQPNSNGMMLLKQQMQFFQKKHQHLRSQRRHIIDEHLLVTQGIVREPTILAIALHRDESQK